MMIVLLVLIEKVVVVISGIAEGGGRLFEGCIEPKKGGHKRLSLEDSIVFASEDVCLSAVPAVHPVVRAIASCGTAPPITGTQHSQLRCLHHH